MKGRLLPNTHFIFYMGSLCLFEGTKQEIDEDILKILSTFRECMALIRGGVPFP